MLHEEVGRTTTTAVIARMPKRELRSEQSRQREEAAAGVDRHLKDPASSMTVKPRPTIPRNALPVVERFRVFKKASDEARWCVARSSMTGMALAPPKRISTANGIEPL
jgi:hypothetical protein